MLDLFVEVLMLERPGGGIDELHHVFVCVSISPMILDGSDAVVWLS